MNDRELTDKVLESIGLRMRETALMQELAKLDTHLSSLSSQKQSLDVSRRQFNQAKEGVTRAAEMAKASATAAINKAKELVELADRAMSSAREAEQYVVGLRKLPDFDGQLKAVIEGIEQATTAHNAITKDVNIIRKRNEELKREGISIPADTQVTPTRVSI